jgi:YgiT-type zinc finger domain-containing protein
MICLICREAEIVERFTDVSFQRGEMQLVIQKVPARICPSCGEAYIDERVALQLLKDAEEVSNAGMRDDVIDYNPS